MFLAYIQVGGGGSWAIEDTVSEAAKLAVKFMKRDWKHIYDFNDQIEVMTFKLPHDLESWVGDHYGIYVKREGVEQSELLPLHEVVMQPLK